eukprot:gene1949-1187_t
MRAGPLLLMSILLEVEYLIIEYCPYTKVEESFHMQAVHDYLYANETDAFDHHLFAGVVPRSFWPSWVLAVILLFSVALFAAVGGAGLSILKYTGCFRLVDRLGCVDRWRHSNQLQRLLGPQVHIQETAQIVTRTLLPPGEVLETTSVVRTERRVTRSGKAMAEVLLQWMWQKSPDKVRLWARGLLFSMNAAALAAVALSMVTAAHRCANRREMLEMIHELEEMNALLEAFRGTEPGDAVEGLPLRAGASVAVHWPERERTSDLLHSDIGLPPEEIPCPGPVVQRQRERRLVRSPDGASHAFLFLLLCTLQFHVAFYASRLLPNSFAFLCSTLALCCVLRNRLHLAVAVLTWGAATVRCDLALLVATLSVYSIVRQYGLPRSEAQKEKPKKKEEEVGARAADGRRASTGAGAEAPTPSQRLPTNMFERRTALILHYKKLLRLPDGPASSFYFHLPSGVRAGLGSLIAAVVLTVPLDSVMWKPSGGDTLASRFVWPEAAVLWFNTYENRSREWGVSPWHWYFSSALPRVFVLFSPIALGLPVVALAGGLRRLWDGYVRSRAATVSTSADRMEKAGRTASPHRHKTVRQVLAAHRHDNAAAIARRQHYLTAVGWSGALREVAEDFNALLVPAFGFVALYSALPHKELRFILPVVPWLTVPVAALLSRWYAMLKFWPPYDEEDEVDTEPAPHRSSAAARTRTASGRRPNEISTKRGKRPQDGRRSEWSLLVFKLQRGAFHWLVLAALVLSSSFTAVSVYVSEGNYPGGDAIKAAHEAVLHDVCQPSAAAAAASFVPRGELRIFIDDYAAMSGISRFDKRYHAWHQDPQLQHCWAALQLNATGTSPPAPDGEDALFSPTQQQQQQEPDSLHRLLLRLWELVQLPLVALKTVAQREMLLLWDPAASSPSTPWSYALEMVVPLPAFDGNSSFSPLRVTYVKDASRFVPPSESPDTAAVYNASDIDFALVRAEHRELHLGHAAADAAARGGSPPVLELVASFPVRSTVRLPALLSRIAGVVHAPLRFAVEWELLPGTTAPGRWLARAERMAERMATRYREAAAAAAENYFLLLLRRRSNEAIQRCATTTMEELLPEDNAAHAAERNDGINSLEATNGAMTLEFMMSQIEITHTRENKILEKTDDIHKSQLTHSTFAVTLVGRPFLILRSSSCVANRSDRPFVRRLWPRSADGKEKEEAPHRFILRWEKEKRENAEKQKTKQKKVKKCGGFANGGGDVQHKGVGKKPLLQVASLSTFFCLCPSPSAGFPPIGGRRINFTMMTTNSGKLQLLSFPSLLLFVFSPVSFPSLRSKLDVCASLGNRPASYTHLLTGCHAISCYPAVFFFFSFIRVSSLLEVDCLCLPHTIPYHTAPSLVLYYPY